MFWQRLHRKKSENLLCKGTPADLIAEECLPEWSDWNYDKNNNSNNNNSNNNSNNSNVNNNTNENNMKNTNGSEVFFNTSGK